MKLLTPSEIRIIASLVMAFLIISIFAMNIMILVNTTIY